MPCSTTWRNRSTPNSVLSALRMCCIAERAIGSTRPWVQSEVNILLVDDQPGSCWLLR